MTKVLAYLVDGRVEQGLFFDKESADTMAFANAGSVVPLVAQTTTTLLERFKERSKSESILTTNTGFEARYAETDLKKALHTLRRTISNQEDLAYVLGDLAVVVPGQYSETYPEVLWYTPTPIDPPAGEIP